MAVRRPRKGQARCGDSMNMYDSATSQSGGDSVDFSAIQSFIQTLGFPIACVCYLFYSTSKEQALHAEESKQWQEALQNNTLALTKLTDYIESRLRDDK